MLEFEGFCCLTDLPKHFKQNLEHQRSASHYVAVDRGVRIHPSIDGLNSNSVYTPVPQATRPQPQRLYQQAQFDQRQPTQPTQQQQQQQPPQQQAYTGQPTNAQTHLQAHILPTGQTVYVNAPPQQHRYATVQYHPHSQQHQVVQQVPSGIGPNGEQYISLVSIQGGAPVHGAPLGAYTYFDAGGQPGAPPAYTIVHPQPPGGSPTGATARNSPSVESFKRHLHSGGRSREKGGRGRRGGGGNGRRGGEQKNQANAVPSPLLETFKAKKKRDWTALDIKGT